jgi:hypothetical protein
MHSREQWTLDKINQWQRRNLVQKLWRGLIKGTVSRDFLLLVFFMNQFPLKSLSIPIGPFRIFSKIRGDIRSSRLTTGVNDTGGNLGNRCLHSFGYFVVINKSSATTFCAGVTRRFHKTSFADFLCAGDFFTYILAPFLTSINYVCRTYTLYTYWNKLTKLVRVFMEASKIFLFILILNKAQGSQKI